MLISDQQIAVFIQQYLYPFARIGALFMVMPVIGARTVAPRVRLALAFLLTLIVVPLLPPLPARPSLSLSSLIFVAQEVVTGIGAGFMLQIVFQVFVLGGQFIAMKMGLGFASMNDPTNGVQTTVLSQFFLMLTTLLFVSINGHLALIELLVASFTSLPAGTWFLRAEMLQAPLSLASWMFSAALVFSLPVLTSLLFVNIAFGVMSRAAPQLNIFAVGFPFTLVVGLVLIWVGLNNFIASFEDAIDYGFLRVEALLNAF